MANQFQEGYLDELPDYKEPSTSKNTAPKFKEGYLDELEDNVPAPSGTEATPAKGVLTTATNPYGKIGADEEAVFWDQQDPLRIQPIRLPREVEDEYYSFIASQKGKAGFSQTDIDKFWQDKGYKSQVATDEYIEAVRKGGEIGKIDYSSWDQAQIEAENERMRRAMEDFAKNEALTGDYASSVDEGARYGFWGVTARKLNDWFDTNYDRIKEQYPNASDEELELLSDQDFIRRERAARQYYEQANKDSGWLPWLAGQATAAIDPTMFLAPGSSTAGRIAGQAAVGAGTEFVTEAIDAIDNVSDGISPANIAFAGALGGGLQGLFELGGKIYRRVKGPKGEEVVEEVVNPTPEEIQASRLQAEAETFQANKAQQQELSPLEQEAQAFKSKPEPTLEDVFPTPEQTAAKEAAMAEKLAGEVEAFKNRGAEEAPAVPEEAPSTPPKFTVDEVVNRVNEIAEKWTNSPEIEVVQSARELGDDVDPDALGFIGDDGKVRIIADNLQSEADIPAVLYHEALGHHGLDQKFGEGLDNLLDRMYQSEGFKKTVDDWLEANPQYKDLYADDPNPQARIVEEYLVSLGESGQLPPPNLLAAIKHYLKELGRKMKIKGLEYTDSEVMTILSMAHNATINGKPNAASNGFRYAKTYHGSAADFDEFDHNYMGSGEGQQVFGWGTYLSDSEGIARSYRDKLSDVKPTWGGMETTYWNLRNNATNYATAKYGQKGSEISELYVNYMNSHGGNTPYDGMSLFKETMPDAEFWRIDDAWVTLPAAEKKLWREVTDDLNTKVGMSKKGKLYEVEIPDDAVWNDWNFQPTEKVKKAFEELGIESSKLSPEEGRELFKKHADLSKELADVQSRMSEVIAQMRKLGDEVTPIEDPSLRAPYMKQLGSLRTELHHLRNKDYDLSVTLNESGRKIQENFPTGEDLYKQLVKKLGSDKKASQALAEKGIAGNKYAANSLSGDPDFNTFNYVVFDDKTPKITKKYMKKVDKRDALKSDSRFRMEDKRLRKETKLSNEKSYEDWKRNWEFDEFIDELEQSSPSRYMKRKGESEGPQTNFGRRETTAEERPYVPMGNVRSNRPGVISILEEAAPVKDRQTQDEWIAASNEVRKSAKQHQKALNPGSEPAEVLAARDSSLKLANRLTDLSVKIRDGMATDNEKWQLEVGMAQLADLLEAIDGVVSNAGRVLRSMGIEVANDAAQLAKVRALLRNKSNLSADEIAEKLADVNFDPNATAQLAKDNFKPSKLDYLTSLRYSAMLSGLTTPSKAIVGTMSNMLLRNASYAGSMFTGKIKPGEWQAYNLGMIRSIVEASRAFKESYGLGVASNSAINRLELQEGVNLPFSKVTEYPRRTLAGIDAFFREIIRGGEVNALAYRQALNEGFSPNTPDFEARVDYLVGLPMDEVALQLKNAKTAKTKDKALIERLEEEYKLLRDIDKLATKQSNLQQLLDNDSMVLKGLEAAGRHGPVSRFIVQNSLPFARNVDNIARMAGRNSWLGLMSPYVRGELKASPERRALMISQMNVGSLLIGLAGYMGYNELAVPSNADDRDMAALDQTMGKTPGSIKIGDEWVSLAGLDAIAVPFITAATTAKAYKDGRSDEMSYAMATLSAFNTMVKAFADETIIGQLEQFTGLFERGSNYSEFLTSLPSSFMPAAVRQYTQWGEDRAVLDTRGDKSMTDRAIGRVLAGTPEAARKWLIDTFGLSELPQKLDIFGRPIYREGDAVAAITGVGRGGKEETDPAIREVHRLSQLAGKAAVTKTPDDFTVNGEKVKLTPEQRMKWQYDAGQYILSDIKEAMADPVWNTLSDAEKFEEIKIITKEAKEDAKWDNFRDILESDPDNQPIVIEEDPAVYEGYVEE